MNLLMSLILMMSPTAVLFQDNLKCICPIKVLGKIYKQKFLEVVILLSIIFYLKKSTMTDLLSYQELNYFFVNVLLLYRNLIFIGSANGIEVAVLNFKNGATWEQWLLGDASRAELPLNAARQETFPLGMAYDITAVDNIPWGEGALPPMPRLLLLSDEGVLSIFNIVNTAANATRLCGPPKEHLNDNIFVTKSPTTAPSLAATVVAPK